MKQSLKINLSFIATFMLCMVLFVSSSFSQNIKATAHLDTDNVQIGQQVKLKLSIQYKVDNGKHLKIRFPEVADTIRKEVEVVSQSKVDTIIPDKNNPFEFVQTKTLMITSFDSGYWAMAPFKFIINDDTNGVLTEPNLLHVGSVAVDTTQAIKDIKPPFDESYSFIDWIKDNIYPILGILAGILIILIAIYYLRRYYKNKPEVVVVETPKIPAHIIAFEKLEKLKNEKLWQEGKLKQFHSVLTDIIREYIENRFKIQALEQTTDEILFGFRAVAIDEESKVKLKNVLILADLVKFAKEQPLPTENEISISNAYDFINGTKRDEEIVAN